MAAVELMLTIRPYPLPIMQGITAWLERNTPFNLMPNRGIDFASAASAGPPIHKSEMMFNRRLFAMVGEKWQAERMPSVLVLGAEGFFGDSNP
jgi:hypothetical protein